jgi:hypothetical protein
MTFPTPQQAYAKATGSSQIPTFVFEDRDPTSNDYNPSFKIYMGWVNTITKAIWYLESLNAANGVVTPQWRAVGPIVVSSVGPAAPITASSDYAYPIGQTWVDSTADDYYVMLSNPTDTTGYWVKLSSGGQSVEEFQVDAHTSPGTDPVVPDSSSVVTVTGGQVAAETTANVIQTNSLAANTYTVQVQRSTAKASTTVGSNGVCHFSSNQFSVDSNGFVTLSGGGQAIDSVAVDANTAPGTNPVVPTVAGLITVTGGQVAAGTTANVIRTISLAANTYTNQIQRSKTEASSTVGSNGVSHFNSADFTVDSNGFVSLVSGASDINSVVLQVFTSNGTYTPTSGMVYCIIEVCGGGGGGGSTNPAAGQGGAGAGGSAGGYSRGRYTAAQIGASQTVTIGAGGAAASGGGTTSVGALIQATGGGAGSSINASAMNQAGTGAAGVGSGGSVNLTGGQGHSACIIVDSGVATMSQGGQGGSSYFGGGPVSSFTSSGSGTTSSPGTAAAAPGAGGSGGSSIFGSANAAGGAGASGIVIITEYVS